MSKQRYVSTSFWDDSWIRTLNPLEKFLYLYLMTNPLTNIAGVYKITLERISFDTGLKCAAVEEILEKFAKHRKACLYGEYIIIPAWPEHQQWKIRSKIKAGIELILGTLPEAVRKHMVAIGYRYPIDTLAIPYVYGSNYPDSDSDLDSDSSTEDLDDTLSGDRTSPDPEVARFLAQQQREERKVPVKEITDYLNTTCRTNFSPQADYLRRLVKARWNEGYRLEDFKAVIDAKARQWLTDPKMVKYLRPKTLFSASNFDGYLQEARQSVRVAEQRCPECGARNGLHTESCPVLQQGTSAKQGSPGIRDGPEPELPAFE